MPPVKLPKDLGSHVALALSQMWAGGLGLSHQEIDLTLASAGLDPAEFKGPKHARLADALRQASPPQAAKLVEELLEILRDSGAFNGEAEIPAQRVEHLRQAFERAGVSLDTHGRLQPQELSSAVPPVPATRRTTQAPGTATSAQPLPSEKSARNPAAVASQTPSTERVIVTLGALIAVLACPYFVIQSTDARWAQIIGSALIIGAVAIGAATMLRRWRSRWWVLVASLAVAATVVTIAGNPPSSAGSTSSPQATKSPAPGPSSDDYQGPWGANGYQGGWGPERDTFKMTWPAPYPVFNSITDNPRHGDERNFVQIKRATAGNQTYGENAAFESGKQYEVYALFSNGAQETQDPALIARDVRLKLLLGKPGTDVGVGAMVTSANAEDVWDGSHIAGDSKFSVTYVKGSARIYTLTLNGAPLPDKDLLTSGATLGCKRLDGVIPPAACSGYVTLRVVARPAE